MTFLRTVSGLASISVVIVCGVPLHARPTSSDHTIYDSDPKHLWNRLNETLFNRTAPDGRQFGLADLDILYWFRTKHLLVEPSHQQALAILDEFSNTHGENLIRDPLKRAFLQRDLWELFDWSARTFRKPEEARASRELQSRLATLVRRLALTTNEIASLPDNYVQTEAKGLADLPRGLLRTNGNWLSVGVNGYNDVPVAPTHVSEFDGHSAFSLMVRMPAGRQSSISYLDQLRSFAQSERLWIYQTNRFLWVSTNEPKEILELNSKIPQFPENTEWALVRRACVIDTEGRIQPTPITESIQLRRYRKVDRRIPDSRLPESTNIVQEFFQFEMDRQQSGALRAIGKNEAGFPFVHFRGKGIDPFEEPSGNRSNAQPAPDSARFQTAVLGTCYQCHSDRGIFSVLSYTGFSSPAPSRQPTDLAPVNLEREALATIYWKQRQFDWGLLQGLLRNADQP